MSALAIEVASFEQLAARHHSLAGPQQAVSPYRGDALPGTYDGPGHASGGAGQRRTGAPRPRGQRADNRSGGDTARQGEHPRERYRHSAATLERCHDAVTAAAASGEPGAPAMALRAPLNSTSRALPGSSGHAHAALRSQGQGLHPRR